MASRFIRGLLGAYLHITKKGEIHTLSLPRTQFNPEVHPFRNEDVGLNMNVNAAFGGTPDPIHDGTDRSLYTASAIAGSKFTFNSSAHAFQGIVTIVDYTLIDAGETVTLNGTVKTAGGTDWTAATSNAATATSLASALDGISGFSASAAAAVVTVLADDGFDITQLDTSGEAGELIASAQSVLTNNPAVNDTMQFAKGSDITMANFTGVSMRIFVDSDWQDEDSIVLYAWDTDGNAQVGDRVPLEDFFQFGDFDNWQSIAISLAAFNIATSTIVDAFRIQVITRGGAKSPAYYIDRFQIEQTGTPVVFKATTPQNTVFHVTELRIALADTLDSTLANATIPSLSYKKLLGVSKLTNGITFRRVQNGKTQFSVSIQQLGDFLSAGSNIVQVVGDTVDTFLTLLVEFPEAIILEGNTDDNFLSFTIADDLSGLDQLTAVARGAIEVARV